MIKTILSCLSICLSSALFGAVDFEENIQSFVLETKQIVIPGHPYPLNPSIIRWRGELLMTFRIIPDRKDTFRSELGIVWLDDNFTVIGEPQMLKLKPTRALQHVPSRAEDGRLVEAGGKLYLVYDDNCDEKITRAGFRVYIAELEIVGKNVVPHNVEMISQFEGNSPFQREKNWVPFQFQNELLLAYSLDPHRILRYLPGTGECETFCESKSHFEWDWGVLRGGTTGLNIDDKFYLSFFHSSKKMISAYSNGQEILHYFMGAYTFSLEPPFEVTQISPEPIVGKNFYHGKHYKPYWHPVRVVFPVGFICEDEVISVFYGRQDHEIWVAKIDKKGLLNSLIPAVSEK